MEFVGRGISGSIVLLFCAMLICKELRAQQNTETLVFSVIFCSWEYKKWQVTIVDTSVGENRLAKNKGME